MRKLNHIINWVIWSLLALYLLLMILVHVPACQRYLARSIASAISEKLATDVSVGRVDLGFLNRVIIDDIHIFDQRHKEMLRVARLTARLDVLPLTEGRISISSAQVFGAHARFYKTNANAKPNFQFALDSLASKDTTSHTPLDLRINSLIMRRSSVSYDQLDAPRTDGLFNLKHLRLSDISTHLILRTLTDDSLDVDIKRLGLSEQSGLSIDKIAMRLKAGRSGATLRNFQLLMPSTQIQTDSIDVAYHFEGERFIDESLTFKGLFSDTYVTPSDLRCFHAPLKNSQRPIHLETAFQGTSRQLSVPMLRLFTETDDINLQANGQVDNWRHNPSWTLTISDLRLSESTIDFLQKNITQIPEPVRRIGDLRLNGHFNGEKDGGMSAEAKVQTSIGNLSLDFLMAGDKQFQCTVNTDGINLHQLTDNEKLGMLMTEMRLDGQLASAPQTAINAQGFISQLDYNDYTYTNLAVNGSYSLDGISGFLKIEDPNLRAEVEGSYTKDDKENAVSIVGTVNHLAPKALNLTDKWDNAVFSANLDADFKAKTLNDARGTLRVSNFSMKKEEQAPYVLDNLLITSGFNDQQHYVTLISDFAKAELKGVFEYNTLAQSIINFVGASLPRLPGLPPTSRTANNDFTLKLQVFKTDWLQQLLGVNLAVHQPITLDARVNDHRRSINLDAELPAFDFNGNGYANGSIHLTNPVDTIRCDIRLNQLTANNQHLGIALTAKAIDNKLATSLSWDNEKPQGRMSGELNSTTELYRNLADKSEAHVRIHPSHILMNDVTWDVEPSDILYTENNLNVDHFMLHNGKQHIIIDGRGTKSTNDSLSIDLNDVEVAYILDLVNFHSVEFSGKASGKAFVKAPFGDFAAHTDLTVEAFKFERGRMGTLYAHANWNQEAKQIDITALADDGQEAQTHVKGYVSPTYNTIDLGIRAEGTYLDFMHNFTHTFLSSITGHANGDVRLAGTLDNINLTGKLVVDGEATVTALNTTYQLRQDTVLFVPDDIQLNRLAVYDKYNHLGRLSGGVHHEHLTNLTFDLFVEADNLLAYDFKDFGESTFYGTVFASGDVAIHGRPGEVTIDCNVTPEKNSVFVYNASSPDEISNQEFIEWGSASQAASSTGSRYSGDTASTGDSKDSDVDIPTDIYINFLVNCTPEATLRLLMDANTNDYITLNGDGTIRATFYNKGPFNMFGTYTVDHGTYGITIQNIIKKNFVFNRGGTIIFGGDPYNAALNLQASYTVNGVSLSDLNIGNSFASNTIRVNCLMNIGGQPNSPQVDFDLEMPTVNADEQQMVRSIINGQQEMNQQVLYLLGIGRFYNQGQNNAGTDQSDQTSLAMQSFLSGTISTQINSLLSTVIKNDNWNFGANISTGNEGWHNAEYEGLISGRMLDNRLLLNGQFGYRDNATQANPSFIGDFDIQYLLYPNGNLAVKMYNQTNDRYFTKSSLNTQGLGLIMKKDFNGIRDLFSTKKKRKHTKKSGDKSSEP